MLVTPGIEALVPYEAGKPVEELAREQGILDAVKLASNENPFGPGPLARKALARALDEVGRYPDAAAYAFREKLGHVLGVERDEIIQGAGSNEVIELLIRTFTTPSAHIVFAEPAFVVYRMAAMAHGVPFSAVPLAGATHDLAAMARAIRPETRLVFIANPNNPTGTYVSREALEGFLGDVPESVIVAVDEAYFEYADARDYPDCLKLRGTRERLVVLRTFSKIHGLAALRVGYGVGPKNLVNYMNRVRAPFNVGMLAQVAALAALDDHAHVERSRATNLSERARLEQALAALGFEVTPSQTNFLYVTAARPARPIYEALLARGVIVRPFSSLPKSLRITIGTPEENSRLLAALSEVPR